jgi:diguanylate cyclase (GGDEF)-like protein
MPPPTPPVRFARPSGDPTLGLLRRALLGCLGAGAVAVLVTATLGWDRPAVRWLSPFLLVAVVACGWLVLRRPRATVPVSRLVLVGVDLLWLGTMVARLAAGGWEELFPTTPMGLAVFVAVGFLVLPPRWAVVHAAAVVALAVGTGLLGLLLGPRIGATGDHALDLLRYGAYLAVLAVVVGMLSRAREHASRAFLVAEHASAEAASLREIASRDPLTGAANRRRLEQELAYQARAVGSGMPVALLFLDLDRFKAVNDRHGHAVGDRVLVAVARALEAHVRSGDLVARLGGEEFVVVAPGMDVLGGGALAERLRTALPGAVRRVVPVDVTASLGVTGLGPREDPADAIARVDALMYRAKDAGRDRVVVDAPGHPPHVQPPPSRTGQDEGSSVPS